MNILSKISNFIFEIEKALVTLLIGLIFVSLISGVISRYFFNNPLHWHEEASVFALAWVTFIGGSMTIKRQQSAAVSLLVDKVKGRSKFIIESLTNFIVVIFAIFLFVVSIVWISSPYIAFQKSIAIQLPMIIPYLSVPIGFFFMAIHSLELFVNRLVAGNKGEGAI